MGKRLTIIIGLMLLVSIQNLAGTSKRVHVNKYAHLSCAKKYKPTHKELLSDHKRPDQKDSDAIYKEYEIKTEYPREVMREVEDMLQAGIPRNLLKDRADYRKEKWITIDGKETIDRDDIIHVRRLSNGNFLMKVAVPDVAAFISPTSHTGKWVFDQATSHYLRDAVFHMLPRDLVSGLLSMDPMKKRLALSFEMEINAKSGIVSNFRARKAIIQSEKAYSYEEFQQKIDRPDTRNELERDIIELYQLLKDKNPDGIKFPFESEMRAEFNSDGSIKSLLPYGKNVSNHLIEVMMVTVNSQVAKFMKQNHIPGIFRGQDAPEKKRVETLIKILNNVGYSIRYNEDLGILGNIQAVFHRVRKYEHPEVMIPLLFYVTKQATNSSTSAPHFFLNVHEYAFTTSPLRRVSDYWNQIMIKEFINGSLESAKVFELLKQQEVIVGNDNTMIRTSKQAERQWQNVKKIRLSDIEQGMGYNAIIIRQYAEHDLVFLPNKKVYVEVEKRDSTRPTGQWANFGKKALIQIKEIETESGTIYGVYR